MSKNTRKVVNNESELQKLIEDTRKLHHVKTTVYNPTVNLILNGTEIANFQTSGFPSFKDIKIVIEQCIPKYRPISLVVDTSLRFLLPEDEISEYEQVLKGGLQIKSILVSVVEVQSEEDVILTSLKLALEKNAKILANTNLIESYEIIKQQKIPVAFVNKKFQVHYKITSSEITNFEQQ